MDDERKRTIVRPSSVFLGSDRASLPALITSDGLGERWEGAGFAAGVGELNTNLGSECMDVLHDPLQRRNLAVCPQAL